MYTDYGLNETFSEHFDFNTQNDTFVDVINETTFFKNIPNISDLITNRSENGTYHEQFSELLKMTVTTIVLGMMILITIIGNVFVIAAIILERNLQNIANYLVASLAVADLLVACLVMPLGAVYEISAGWILGPELCDIWTSCDVLCCTASILHLVAIAMDRYWAVTNIDYIHSRTSKRVIIMIFGVWVSAVIVSLAPQFGWKDPDYLQRIEQQKCMVSQDVSYQVFATFCTFYLPLLVILMLYWKIYQTARKRIYRRHPKSGDQHSKTKQKMPHMKHKKLGLRFSRFAIGQCRVRTTLGLVEGNSTNTINTVEDTDISSSNLDNKLRVEEELARANTEEVPATSLSQISTVSHCVTVSEQQHTSNELVCTLNQERSILEKASLACDNESITYDCVDDINEEAETITTEFGTEIYTDFHVQRNFESQRTIAASITTTSNATTATSIATLSPETPFATSKNTTFSEKRTNSSVPIVPKIKNSHQSSNTNPIYKATKRKETLEAKRERKAAKTLAIITGAFVICWLPFFVMALMLPLCPSCDINESVASFFLWLGYFNSTLNPVIYTVFSPEFRQAFKRILFGGQRSVHYRSGKV